MSLFVCLCSPAADPGGTAATGDNGHLAWLEQAAWRLASCWPCGCGSTASRWYPLLIGSEDGGVAALVERGGRVRSAWCEGRGRAGAGGRLWGVIHGRVGEPEPAWPVADLLGDSQTDEPAGVLAMVPEDLSMKRFIRVAVNDSSGCAWRWSMTMCRSVRRERPSTLGAGTPVPSAAPSRSLTVGACWSASGGRGRGAVVRRGRWCSRGPIVMSTFVIRCGRSESIQGVELGLRMLCGLG